MLRAKDCPWNRDTCIVAAKAGHLEVLQWLRESGCPWDERTCEHALDGEHREAFCWARHYGCPMSEDAFLQAKLHRWIGDHEGLHDYD